MSYWVITIDGSYDSLIKGNAIEAERYFMRRMTVIGYDPVYRSVFKRDKYHTISYGISDRAGNWHGYATIRKEQPKTIQNDYWKRIETTREQKFKKWTDFLTAAGNDDYYELPEITKGRDNG